MNTFSDYVVNAIINEHRREMQREAEQRRLVNIVDGQQNASILQKFRGFVQRNLLVGPQLEVMGVTGETVRQVETRDLRPEELRYQEAKRLFYERTAQGNALAEVEEFARQM